ncbi:MAG: hypothetical protein KDA59_14890, partial [Planctomycetales bacterium]|nr:hypothetical protein [Planctomycetales bacterium]
GRPTGAPSVEMKVPWVDQREPPALHPRTLLRYDPRQTRLSLLETLVTRPCRKPTRVRTAERR